MKSRYSLTWVIVLLAFAIACSSGFPSRLLPAVRSAANGVCHIGECFGGDRRSVALIFEEQHLSRTAQIQEAMSLVRLYRDVGLRHVVLEGYLQDRPAIRAGWAAERRLNEAVYLDVVTTLLRDGEISAAEFLKLTFDDVVLHPGETSSEHSPELDPEAAEAPFRYLWAIAQKGVDPKRSETARRMLAEAFSAGDPNGDARSRNAFEFVLGADAWALATARRLEGGGTLPASEGVHLLQEIRGRATQSQVTVSSQVRNAMDRALTFWRARSSADQTLGRAARALGTQPDVKWIAVSLGAAHTRGVADALRRASQPYAILTPLVLRTGDHRGDLNREALDRRSSGQAVHSGALAAWIEQSFPAAHRKPEPMLDSARGQAEVEIRMFVADIVGSGAALPAAGDLRGTFVAVDPARIKVVSQQDALGRRVFEFPITVLASESGTERTIWVRAAEAGSGETAATGPTGIETRLQRALREIQEERPGETAQDTQLETVAVTPSIHAVFAPSQQAFFASAAGLGRR